MKKYRAIFVAMAVTTIAACGGGGGGTGQTASGGNAAQSYSVGGTISGLAGSATLQLNAGNDTTVSTDGAFAFTTQIQSGSTYSVGVLNPPIGQVCSVANGSGSIASAIVSNVSITCVARPHFLYLQNTSNLLVSKIDSTTGSVANVNGSPFAISAGLGPATIDAKARFTFVATNLGSVQSYVNDPITGAISGVATGSYPYQGSNVYALASTPVGDYLYSLNGNSYYPYGITGFKVDKYTGALTTINGSPFTPSNNGGGNSPSTIGIDPAGKFLFVGLNTTSSFTGYPMAGVLAIYSINQQTGALTLVSSASVGEQPTYVTAHPNGRFVYVEYKGDMIHQSIMGGVNSIVIDNSSGSIVSQTFVTSGNFSYFNPGPLVIDPSGKFGYVADYNHITISAYNIDQTSGALTPLSGSPFPVGGGTSIGPIVIDSSGSYLYVTGSNGIYVQSINSITGALTVLPSNPVISSVGTSIFAR